MTRFKDWLPQGVIPAGLLPFHADFSIGEPACRRHLRDVAGVERWSLPAASRTVAGSPPR